VRIERTDGGVTAPGGFRAAGLHCGIKANGKPDLALILSDTVATAAGVFTLNLARAAPVLVCQEQLSRSGGRAQAILTNSGCANACTGPQGMADAREMVALGTIPPAVPTTKGSAGSVAASAAARRRHRSAPCW
jgi:glutamate N-acetyltransferase/amino-acid N-acetyltransferase